MKNTNVNYSLSGMPNTAKDIALSERARRAKLLSQFRYEFPIEKHESLNAGVKYLRDLSEIMGNMNKGMKSKDIGNLLGGAIKKMSLEYGPTKTRIGNSPWTKLPGVGTFRISLNGINLLAKHFGLTKMLKPDIEFIPLSKTRNVNRFMEHQILRLERNKINPRLYWSMVWIIMKRSNVFRVAAINHVFRNWHRKLPLWFVININRKVSKIVNDVSSNMVYHRVYIEKIGSDKFRPLGVPTPEWRVFLHMLQNFTLQFLGGSSQFPHQHAFLPGRGCLTAWQDIFNRKLHKCKWLVNWDFKQFYPSVSVKMISLLLQERGVPSDVAKYIEEINTSVVSLPSEIKLDEAIHLKKKDIVKDLAEYKKSLGREIADHLKQHRESLGNPTNSITQHRPDLIGGVVSIGGKPDLGLYERVKKMNLWKENFKFLHPIDGAVPTYYQGVPQGSPLSPMLANLVMDIWLKCLNFSNEYGKLSTVGYADDSISGADQPISVSGIAEATEKYLSHYGIVVNKLKSYAAKRNGRWTRGGLTFLGLNLDGNRLKGFTRKGSRLLLTKDLATFCRMEAVRLKQGLKLQDAEALSQFLSKESDYPKKESWERFFKEKIFGFAQSRMYNGSLNLESLEQDFEYKYKFGSWSALVGSTLTNAELNVFNSSSYACLSLTEMFRYNQLSKSRRKAKPYFLPKFSFRVRRVKSGEVTEM